MDAPWSLRRLEAAVEGFATQLQCPICLCAYDTPVSLPCNHCFCEECIHRALELKQMCPICKLPARKRRLRYDQMIRQLIAATEALCAPAPDAEAAEAEAQKQSEAEIGAKAGPPSDLTTPDRSSEQQALEVAAESEQPPSTASDESTQLLPSPVDEGSTASSDTVVIVAPDAAADTTPESDELAAKPLQHEYHTSCHVIDELVADSEAAGGSSPAAEAIPELPVVEAQEEEGKADVTANADAAASAPAAEFEAPPLNGPFVVGDLVEVTDRTWAGVNKPGGTGRITAVNDDGTYGVKFVIGTRREHSVHDYFIHRPPEEFVSDVTPSRAARKRQRRAMADSPLSNGQTSAPSSDQKKRAKRSASLTTPSPVRSARDPSKRSDVVILCSGFEDPEANEIAEWAYQFGAELVPQWSSSVTHLIAKCVRADGSAVAAPTSTPTRRKSLTPTGKRRLFSDSQLQNTEEQSQLRDRWVKTRSLKYLKAITAGRWVVSEHWLKACADMGDRVDEAPFEADGHYKGRRIHDAVRRARIAREANLRSESPGVDPSAIGTQLFSSFCFHIVGEFLPPMPLATEVDALLRIGGGNILPFLNDIPHDMQKDENRERRLVVVCDKINPHTLSKEIKRLTTLRQLQNPAPEAIVNYHWVINSISDAKLREFP